MNIQNENETNAQTLSAPSVLPPSISPSPGRPLSRLSVLSERQLEHVHAWIKECVPSRKISELCSKEFQKEIPHMTFVRYAHRFEPFRHLNGLNDSKEAAKEISQYAATGNPSFSTNTLELLEQQAFDLALAHNRDADAADLQILEKLWTLIHKAKNTAIRERHAAVQEQKIALRREELELKRQLTARLCSITPGGTRSPSPTSTSRDAANQTESAQADQKTSRSHVAQNFSLPPSNPTPNSCTGITSSDKISAQQECVSPCPLGEHRLGEGVRTDDNTTDRDSKCSVENPVQNLSADSASSANSPLIPASPSAPADPSDDSSLHIEGLLNGTIKPSWIPAEVPCDDEETFLSVWLRNRKANAKPASTPNLDK